MTDLEKCVFVCGNNEEAITRCRKFITNAGAHIDKEEVKGALYYIFYKCNIIQRHAINEAALRYKFYRRAKLQSSTK